MSWSRRSFFLVSCGVLVLVAAVAVGQGTANNSPPNITVSKEVTRAVGPLTDDGYVDYLGAVNASLGKGVTAANNANVLFWRALGPHPENATMPPKFFQLMGIDSPPEDGEYFVNLSQFIRDGGNIEFQDPLWEKIFNQQGKASSRPWKSKDYPHIAEWLVANEKPLALVVEGSRRTKYYSPLVLPENNDEGIENTMVSVLLPGVQKSRSFARALTARAMLRTRNGKTAAAWEDLLACHRLGRLVGRGPTLVEGLVGMAIDGIAIQADLAFLEHTKPDVCQISKYQQDLASLAPLPDVGASIDLCERFMFLDVTQNLARYGSKRINEVLGHDNGFEKLLRVIFLRTVDWDTVMRNGNLWYDRIVEAVQTPDRKSRNLAMGLIEADLAKLGKEAASPMQFIRIALGSNKAVGKATSNVLIGFLLPAVSAAQTAEDRSVQQVHNLQVALALAAYRSDHDAYPESLKQLAPRYLKKVPGDMFSGKSLVYEPTDTGYLLYSFGRNEKDDGGKSYDDEPESDDLRIQMPMPPNRE